MEGLKTLQDKMIIHRDLKLANLLLHFPDNPELNMGKPEKKLNFLKTFDIEKIHFEIKIADFGFAHIFEHEDEIRNTFCGTPVYMAPQVLNKDQSGHSSKIDVWSVGIIYYELIIGKPPFLGRNMT